MDWIEEGDLCPTFLLLKIKFLDRIKQYFLNILPIFHESENAWLMIVLGDVAVLLKMEIGYWIFWCVDQWRDFLSVFSQNKDIFHSFLWWSIFFVSQGNSVVVSRKKKRQIKEDQRRYLVIPDIISKCSGQCGLFNLKRIASCLKRRSCNNQYLTEHYFMPKE